MEGPCSGSRNCQGIISTLNPVVGSVGRFLARSGADIVTIGAAADVTAAAAAAVVKLRFAQ